MRALSKISVCSPLILLLILMGCTSGQKHREQVPSIPGQESINIEEVTRNLGMDRPRESLGYDERKFNTCDVGGGYPQTENCRERYLGVVNLRLQCRDTSGTTSKIHHQLTPVTSGRVRWNWANLSSYVSTDRDGYAQVKIISRRSPSKQRLRLTIDGKFLAMTAGEMGRIVTPNEWCR